VSEREGEREKGKLRNVFKKITISHTKACQHEIKKMKNHLLPTEETFIVHPKFIHDVMLCIHAGVSILAAAI